MIHFWSGKLLLDRFLRATSVRTGRPTHTPISQNTGGSCYFAIPWTPWTPWTPLCTLIFESRVYRTTVTAKNDNGNTRPACPRTNRPPHALAPLRLPRHSAVTAMSIGLVRVGGRVHRHRARSPRHRPSRRHYTALVLIVVFGVSDRVDRLPPRASHT